MAGAVSHHALASTQSYWLSAQNSRFQKRTSNVRLVYEGSCRSGGRKLGLVCASGSQSSVVEPVQLPSDGNNGHTPKKSSKFTNFIAISSYSGYLLIASLGRKNIAL